ncbi:hypothetical protein Tco_1467466 [Tanacetum coccineum]
MLNRCFEGEITLRNDDQSINLKCGDAPSIYYNNLESLKKLISCEKIAFWPFKQLKKVVDEAPILIAPNWTNPFDNQCDASDFAIGPLRFEIPFSNKKDAQSRLPSMGLTSSGFVFKVLDYKELKKLLQGQLPPFESITYGGDAQPLVYNGHPDFNLAGLEFFRFRISQNITRKSVKSKQTGLENQKYKRKQSSKRKTRKVQPQYKDGQIKVQPSPIPLHFPFYNVTRANLANPEVNL